MAPLAEAGKFLGASRTSQISLEKHFLEISCKIKFGLAFVLFVHICIYPVSVI